MLREMEEKRLAQIGFFLQPETVLHGQWFSIMLLGE
jgi:hypothetical protein